MNVRKLKGLMAEKNITQKTLAQRIELSENALSMKFRGKSPITDADIFKICRALEITDPIQKCDIFLSDPSQ